MDYVNEGTAGCRRMKPLTLASPNAQARVLVWAEQFRFSTLAHSYTPSQCHTKTKQSISLPPK